MKRNSFLPTLLAALVWTAPTSLPAQDSSVAAAAEREEREANFRSMRALIEQLNETIQSQNRRMNSLVEEVHNLREQVDRLKNKAESTATLDAIKQLATKIEEVDTKRQKDNELLQKEVKRQIASLGKEVASTLAAPRDPIPTPTPRHTEKPAVNPTPAGPPENVLEYKVKKGDSLGQIVADLRAIEIKVTRKQVMDANPKVNWDRLPVGQTIYIPQVPK